MSGSRSSIRGRNVPGQLLDYDCSSLSCFANYNNKNLQDDKLPQQPTFRRILVPLSSASNTPSYCYSDFLDCFTSKMKTQVYFRMPGAASPMTRLTIYKALVFNLAFHRRPCHKWKCITFSQLWLMYLRYVCETSLRFLKHYSQMSCSNVS